MANKLTYQTGEPDIFVGVGHGKTCPYCGGGNTFLIQGNEFNIKEIEVE